MSAILLGPIPSEQTSKEIHSLRLCITTKVLLPSALTDPSVCTGQTAIL